MNAKKYTSEGKANGTVELPSEIFEAEVNETLMHGVVKSYLANQRQGTAKTKGRSEVSGGGVKPFKQKGTGRARAGSNTSPVWVRGGKAHGANPRDYSTTIPKKMKRKALCSAYTVRAGEETVHVIEKVDVSAPKTAEIASLLKNMELSNKKNLLVIGSDDRNIYLSGRNIKNVTVKSVKDVNTYDILNCENIVFAGENLIEDIKEVVK